MRVYVEGIGLRAPGLDGWMASRPVLAGAAPYDPVPVAVPPSPLLPANERRRTVQTVKLALAVGAEAFEAAGRDAAVTPTVFASSGGDGETIHEILSVLASSARELSPTRFHNSVHNAPAGYWNIATRSHAASSSLCCHDLSFAAGLLEAAVQATVDDHAVALIAYDLPYPEPLNGVRPIAGIFGVALLLSPAASAASIARLDIELRHDGSKAAALSGELEALRRGNPAARSLPLLAVLARPRRERLVLDYVTGTAIGVAVEPMVEAMRDRGHDPMAAMR
jgi:hypothetical protein